MVRKRMIQGPGNECACRVENCPKEGPKRQTNERKVVEMGESKEYISSGKLLSFNSRYRGGNSELP
jgi:hypothetical protein